MQEEVKWPTQTKLYRRKEVLGVLIYRSENPEHPDYATWPLQLIAPKTKREMESEQAVYDERELAHEVMKRNWSALIHIKEEDEGGQVQWERERIK